MMNLREFNTYKRLQLALEAYQCQYCQGTGIKIYPIATLNCYFCGGTGIVTDVDLLLYRLLHEIKISRT